MSEAEKGVGQQRAEARYQLEKPAGAAASLPDWSGDKILDLIRENTVVVIMQ